MEYSHILDDSRPAAVGGAQRGGFDTLGDIAGYNGDGASIFLNPGFPNFVSEYGSSVLIVRESLFTDTETVWKRTIPGEAASVCGVHSIMAVFWEIWDIWG